MHLGYNEDLKCYGLLSSMDLWVIQGLREGDQVNVEFNGKWYEGRILFDGCEWYIDAVDSDNSRINIIGSDIEQLHVKIDF